WRVAARVLPAGHRASSPGGQVWDLAQALRDGVLLCHLLNALLPRAVPPRDICPRPQMSQFLCLRNIRTFLTACADKFGLPKHRLFGAFDLFDVQDFGKVIDTLSTLSWTPIAQSKGFTPFPTEDCIGDDDIYSGLSDLIDDTAEEDDDLYDCVEAEGDDGDDIYEDLMRVEAPPAMVEVDRRLCCIQELRQTEERYTETLESICQHFLRPLRHFLQPQDLESIFINIEVTPETPSNPQCSQFLLYGRYCSQVEAATRRLDQLATNTDLRMKLQPQSLAQFGRPKIDGEMKVSSTERRSKVDRYGFLLDKALIICKRRGDSYEAKDVVDLQSHQLRDGGLGPRDGKKWTHTFLLIDTAGLQGYELFFKTRELKKKWLEQFEMALSNIFPEHALADGHDFQMFSFEDTTSCRACQMLLRGTFYQGYRCSRCRAPAHKECLGRLGTCSRGGAGEKHHGIVEERTINKSQRLAPEKKRGDLGLPKMEASQPYSGIPPPPGAMGPALRLSPGDVVEVTVAEAEQLWWQGRNVANGDLGWFPCAAVRPFICVPLPDLSVYSCHPIAPRGPQIPPVVPHPSWFTRDPPPESPHSFYGPPKSSPGAVRSFGSAKARYDFCARDRTELTLREGDIIHVLSKKGHPGWWKGEIYGRVGWFPANYVEEDYSEYC
ncbi:PREDICTED: proto-oncogene vav, partial [Aptenodytes forsteri]|uniref:proto-oncogene vav n=1 Tax=Aptenodytes forsteri TaxID=9233 RepID=UPI000904FE0D